MILNIRLINLIEENLLKIFKSTPFIEKLHIRLIFETEFDMHRLFLINFHMSYPSSDQDERMIIQ